jgi:hypothetical protein
VNTSKRHKIRKPSLDGNPQVDRSVVEKYERLVQNSRQGVIIVKGADYGIAPPVGTSKLLIRSLLGKS